jgi:hypothetical protein
VVPNSAPDSFTPKNWRPDPDEFDDDAPVSAAAVVDVVEVTATDDATWTEDATGTTVAVLMTTTLLLLNEADDVAAMLSMMLLDVSIATLATELDTATMVVATGVDDIIGAILLDGRAVEWVRTQ